MNVRRVALIFLAGVIAASCSEKSDLHRDQNSQAEEAKPDQDVPAVNDERTSEFEVERSSTSEAESAEAEAGNELGPPEEEIGEDCVAFLRATVTVAAKRANGDCPQCPVSTEATEVLSLAISEWTESPVQNPPVRSSLRYWEPSIRVQVKRSRADLSLGYPRSKGSDTCAAKHRLASRSTK